MAEFIAYLIAGIATGAIYALAAMGPTTANSNPGRFVFIRTDAGRERLRPHLNPGNVDKTMSAPCCVIVA